MKQNLATQRTLKALRNDGWLVVMESSEERWVTTRSLRMWLRPKLRLW